MATQAAPVVTPRAAIWEDFVDIFYAPSAVFRRREQGNFFIPLIVITIFCGVGRFLDPDTVSPLLLAVVARIDLITIWITILVAIGLCVTGRIPMRRAASRR